MNPVDRNLLLRVARRLEEQAEQSYKVAAGLAEDPKEHEAAKRKRDRELGDSRDLRDYVKRTEAEQASKTPAPQA